MGERYTKRRLKAATLSKAEAKRWRGGRAKDKRGAKRWRLNAAKSKI